VHHVGDLAQILHEVVHVHRARDVRPAPADEDADSIHLETRDAWRM